MARIDNISVFIIHNMRLAPPQRILKHKTINKEISLVMKTKLKRNLFNCQQETINNWIQDQMVKIDEENDRFADRYAVRINNHVEEPIEP